MSPENCSDMHGSLNYTLTGTSASGAADRHAGGRPLLPRRGAAAEHEELIDYLVEVVSLAGWLWER